MMSAWKLYKDSGHVSHKRNISVIKHSSLKLQSGKWYTHPSPTLPKHIRKNLVLLTSTMSALSSDTVTTIVFGTLAVLIGGITISQGPKIWRRFYGQGSEGAAKFDLESRKFIHHDWPLKSLTSPLETTYELDSIEIVAVSSAVVMSDR